MTVTTDVATLRERVLEAIEREREHIVEVSETIRVNPELQYEEFMASQLLADQLREAGFEVEKPYKGLETAFCATTQERGRRRPDGRNPGRVRRLARDRTWLRPQPDRRVGTGGRNRNRLGHRRGRRDRHHHGDTGRRGRRRQDQAAGAGRLRGRRRRDDDSPRRQPRRCGDELARRHQPGDNRLRTSSSSASRPMLPPTRTTALTLSTRSSKRSTASTRCASTSRWTRASTGS